jgi:hypothetical protein
MSQDEIDKAVEHYCRLNRVNDYQCFLLGNLVELTIKDEIANSSAVMLATLVVMTPAWVHAFCSQQRAHFAHVKTEEERDAVWQQMTEQF